MRRGHDTFVFRDHSKQVEQIRLARAKLSRRRRWRVLVFLVVYIVVGCATYSALRFLEVDNWDATFGQARACQDATYGQAKACKHIREQEALRRG